MLLPQPISDNMNISPSSRTTRNGFKRSPLGLQLQAYLLISSMFTLSHYPSDDNTDSKSFTSDFSSENTSDGENFTLDEAALSEKLFPSQSQKSIFDDLSPEELEDATESRLLSRLLSHTSCCESEMESTLPKTEVPISGKHRCYAKEECENDALHDIGHLQAPAGTGSIWAPTSRDSLFEGTISKEEFWSCSKEDPVFYPRS